MVEVYDRQHDPKLAAQLQQNPKQRHRIRSSRDGYTDTITRSEQAVLLNECKNGSGQGLHPSMVQPGKCGADTLVRERACEDNSARRAETAGGVEEGSRCEGHELKGVLNRGSHTVVEPYQEVT